MDNLSLLGREIARLRQAQGLTQKALAELSGIGPSTLARFETGGVAEFGSGKLLRLLDALGHELRFSPRSQVSTLDDALAERRRSLDANAGSGED
ncbi:helix-turn-helix transcriptional regulator [Rhizobacter sp. OV335]|jgi:HTH-type transcriptional regulator/antitoxin HipB|uniref:helix-turn-helix domain-containing protein n=1 Tax=Rhizobacter sp. OV335 TaxID=1500264 RepID=UPI0009219DE2|nr:helix-turn-helix transcriptional regulator [Rhizobacter sp. OV335]SHM23902.1 Helix-turn-helix domain-containing protein [Rhizobacter sp. OV335]